MSGERTAEEYQVPALAMTAMELLRREFAQRSDVIAAQTLDLIRKPGDDAQWEVNFDTGVMRRFPTPTPSEDGPGA